MKVFYGAKCIRCFIQRFWPLIIWILLIQWIFLNTFLKFKTEPRYYYLRKILGWWLGVSRGTAPVILLCSVLILVPVCRSLLTFLHRLLTKCCTNLLSFWLIRLKHIHMICALTLIIFALIHSGAHAVNIIHFSSNYNDKFPEINFARFKGENPALLLCTWTSCSGVVMLLMLLLIAFTSLSTFRTRHFNTFYIVHHIFIVYLLLLLTHPLSGILKEQYNVEEHVPGCVLQRFNNSISNKKQEPYCKHPPKFQCIPTQSWVWVVIALTLYMIELSYRKYERWQSMEAIEACCLQANALHLKIKCPEGFRPKPGQYILLQCQQISNIEWHPFTIIKCSTATRHNFDLVISARGDWTKRLHRLVVAPFAFDQCTSYLSRLHHKPLMFRVGGPFASPMQEIRNSKYAVCVAAGVGITSYIATLHYLLEDNMENIERLHIIWLVKDVRQFLWFTKLFCKLQNHFWNLNKPDRFQVQLFATQSQQKQYSIFENDQIFSRISFGRPNWREQFRTLNFMYKGKHVNVFCCGPKSLSMDLKKLCLLANKQGYSYNFIKEGF